LHRSGTPGKVLITNDIVTTTITAMIIEQILSTCGNDCYGMLSCVIAPKCQLMVLLYTLGSDLFPCSWWHFLLFGIPEIVKNNNQKYKLLAKMIF